MQHQPAPIGALSNVVTLLDARRSSTRAQMEQVGNRAHGRVLPFPKTANGRNSKEQRISRADREAIGALVDELLVKRGIRVLKTRARAERVSDDEWHRAMGARIRAARIERGISEQDAAKAAGRSVETWRTYERLGKGQLTFPLVEFCQRYGISLDDIIRD